MSDEEEMVEIHLTMSKFHAGLLTSAVCEQYHHFKALHSDDTYGALIQNPTVLAARDVWEAVEAQTHVAEWTNPD